MKKKITTKTKKIICVTVAAIILICAVFTNNKTDESAYETTELTTEEIETQTTKKPIILGYYEDKSLNPFTTDSPLNRSIATLLYDSLYMVDSSYKPFAVIAQESVLKESSLTVKIKEGLTFSDGTSLTPYDVAYSFNEAKQSEFYSSRLENISYATPLSDSVVFTLNDNDIFTESLLTFPIVRSNTGKNDLPVGSGRYTVNFSQDGVYLYANPDNSRGEKLSTEVINLTPVSSAESELYLIQSGDLSFYFDDLSDGKYTKINANTIQTGLNNMVFIGFNCNSVSIADEYIKNAIVTSINPKILADSIFSGMCRYSATPFNPDWYMLEGYQAETVSYSTAKAQQYLNDGGYVYEYESNDYRSKEYEFLKIRILANKESAQKTACAEYIHDTLESLGIDAELYILPFDEYISTLEKGEYDLYLGEVKLSPDMNLSCFFDEDGSLSYGIDTSSTVSVSYKDFRAGNTDISIFIKVFSSQLPFIPICFRDSVAFFSREIYFNGEITEYEPFMNVSSWEALY